MAPERSPAERRSCTRCGRVYTPRSRTKVLLCVDCRATMPPEQVAAWVKS